MGDVAGEWRLHVRAVFRSIVVAILALAGVVVIGVASTITAAITLAANPVALIMGGTGRPNPDPEYVENVEKYYNNPFSSCTPAATCVETPSSLPRSSGRSRCMAVSRP